MNDNDLQRLSAEFPREDVHWRAGKVSRKTGSALALAYIDARDVMDRLDEVCGAGNWQTEIQETPTGRVICRLGVFTENEWIWKADGAGSTDVEGEKGGISDSIKRAAVLWGIGRYLYRMPTIWVPCEMNDQGRWQKWAADPWSYVGRKAGQNPPAQEPSQPPFNARGTADRIKGRIDKCRTKQDVVDLKQGEKAALEKLSAAAEPMYLEVAAAFNARHSAAIDDPAMQAPPLESNGAHYQ